MLPTLRTDQWLFGIATVILLAFIVPPVVMLLRSSVVVGERLGREGTLSLDAYAQILNSPTLPTLLTNTLIFSIGSTVLGLLLGGGLAWFTERTNAPFKELVYTATFVSFAVPGILRTIGWIFLLGPRTGAANEWTRALLQTDATYFNVYSMPSMIFIEGVFWIPLVFLLMAATFRSMDPSLEEAASMSGATTLQALWRITLRLALPGMLAVLLLTLIRSIQAFEVPLLLGVPASIYVFTTEVYFSVHGRMVPDYSFASAYGVLLLAFLAAFIYLYSRATRNALKYATITGKGFRPRQADLGRGKLLAAAFILLTVGLQFLPIVYLVFASFLPTFGLGGSVWEQLTVRNYQIVLQSPEIFLSVQNSLIIGFVSATVVALVGALVAWVLVRTRVPYKSLLDQLMSLPLIFPGVVMGIAILVLYLRVPLPIYGTIWVLVIAYITSFLPYGLRYAHPGLLQIHAELEESAQVSGATWLQTFWRIVLPLLLPALFAGWIFVFLISLRELSVAALLYTARSPVIATTMLDLWENGNVNQVSAFGVLVAIMSIALAIFTYRLTKRWGIRA